MTDPQRRRFPLSTEEQERRFFYALMLRSRGRKSVDFMRLPERGTGEAIVKPEEPFDCYEISEADLQEDTL